MNTLELSVDVALKVVKPLWAIQQVKDSKAPVREKHALFKRILVRVLGFAKSKNSQTAEALIQLFWVFWVFSDLDNALVCLKQLVKCETKNDETEGNKLEQLTSLFLVKLYREFEVVIYD